MTKRILSFLLVLALLVTLAPVTVRAQEDSGVYVTIRTCETDAYGAVSQREQLVYALERGNDLLLSAQTLAEASGFFFAMADDHTLTFTRGYKVVSVDTATSKVRLYDSQNPDTVCSTEVKLPSDVVVDGSQYYLSAAGMLPRLNVNCSLDDGLLTILPNPISLWDYIHDINLNDYVFDIAYCAEVLDCTPKHIESLAYTRLDLTDSVICSLDSDFADSHEFYVVFDRFMKDETATDKTVEYLQETYGAVASLAESYTNLFEWIDLVCPNSSAIFDADFVGGMGKAFETAEAAAKLLTYYNLFHQDNTQKLNMLRCFINNYGYQYNQELIDAARQVEMSYDNFWLGLMFQGGYDFSYGLAEFVTFESLRETFRVDYLSQLPDNELLERTEYFEGLMDACRRIYNKKFDPRSRREIQAWYAHAMLYFYSVEQIYWGMTQHVIDMKGGQYEDYQAFARTASQMESMYAQYLASSLYINNDLFDSDFFNAKSQEYLASLPHVTRMRNPGDAAPAAEYGIYLSAMWEMGLGGAAWTVADIDGDGGEELLITYADVGLHVLVLDNWTIEDWNFDISAYDSLQYLQTADGIVVLRHDYNDGEFIYTTFYTWNGQSWGQSAHWRNFADWDAYTWADTFYQDFWEVDGREATQAEYEARTAPYLAASDIQYNYADPASRTITGDASALIQDLTQHFNQREGFVKTLQIDVNNDLAMDQVYLLYDAVNMWTDLLDPYLELYGPSPIHTYRDRKVTLILAENYGSEILLRVQRLELPYWDTPDLLGDAKASGTTLKIGNETYYYQEYYEPFSTNPMFGGAPTDVLVGMTEDQVRSTLAGYTEWIGSGEGIAQGYLNGQLVQVWYASHYGMAEGEDVVLSANPINHYPSPYSICFDLDMSMDVFTIVRTIHPDVTLSTPWTAVDVVTDTDGTELSKTTCYYMEYTSGNLYLITLLYPYGESDPMPVAFYAELIEPENIPDDVAGQLNAE